MDRTVFSQSRRKAGLCRILILNGEPYAPATDVPERAKSITIKRK